MIAAEKWYEQQVRYQKYGLNMKPVQNKIKKEKTRTGFAAISGKDKLRMLVITVFMGALFIGFIATTAYAAKIQYDINRLAKETVAIQGEIENLNVKIKSATNIRVVEEKAMSRLGMVYPQMNQIVFIEAQAEPEQGFALALKEQAYN